METIFSDINGPGGPLYNLHAFLVQGDRLFADRCLPCFADTTEHS